MFQRIIIVCVVTVLFSGGVIKNIITQKEENQDTVIETEEILNEEENASIEEITESTEDTSHETISEINNQEQVNNTENIIVSENKTTTDTIKKDNDIKKENPKPTTTNTGNQKPENKGTSNQVNQNQEEQKKPTNNKESAKAEKITEEYIYNDTETKRLMADIDTIAKRNPDLWGKNGEKLYKIQKSPSLVGKNYMYPYSFSQIEGKVLNVYSVTFLVYAADYKKTGFPTQTRYFVDITNY